MCALSVKSLVIMLEIVVVVVVVDLKAKSLFKVENLNMVVLNATIGSKHSKLGQMFRSLPMWL